MPIEEYGKGGAMREIETQKETLQVLYCLTPMLDVQLLYNVLHTAAASDCVL